MTAAERAAAASRLDRWIRDHADRENDADRSALACWTLLRDELAALANPYSPDCFVLINPCTGQMFPASDPRCPLMEVSCLVTPYNVWANIQPGSLPCDLSYDILNPDLWRPFFGRRLPPPPTGLHSIQEDVQYEPTSSLYTLDIERVVRER
jgi:hypothetical protein